MKNITKNILLLLTTLLLTVIIDRVLLLYFDLPLWEWDKDLHYKHRSNISRNWGERYNNKPIIINEFGHHDYPITKKKRKNELRILNLGDSITMGHGVTRDETYSKYLEEALSSKFRNDLTVQAINTGVQGYSTFQEYEVLRRNLEFSPDIITIGFCLNDATEPFTVNSDLGGIGLDYHRVTQAPNKFLSYFLNETGFGRLIQEIRIRKLDARQEKQTEINNVKEFLRQRENKKYDMQWRFTLKQLSKVYRLCKTKNLPVILLIFPYTFQFESSLSWPQEMLISHAEHNNVKVIDYLPIFKKLNNKEKYFLDEDHLTPEGHKVVAKLLSELIQKELLN